MGQCELDQAREMGALVETFHVSANASWRCMWVSPLAKIPKWRATQIEFISYLVAFVVFFVLEISCRLCDYGGCRVGLVFRFLR